eukprot:GHVN01098506.1.p1 GENE.GHVN01098506.1~~GHVN01098506.1.p1  ORF type:complete len:126 (+),score=12.64 GHVN01098506.1:305-682(+)
MVERAAPSMNGAQPCKDDWAQPMENLMLVITCLSHSKAHHALLLTMHSCSPCTSTRLLSSNYFPPYLFCSSLHFQAAHFLQIAQLLHIAQAAFAFHIRGLTLVEKARQFLHIENDFTPEEEQAVC